MLDYEQRERVKAHYRPIMEDEEMPMFYRVQAAENIIATWFCRSCEAYVNDPDVADPVFEAMHDGHPDFKKYMYMILNQRCREIGFPQKVYYSLRAKHDSMPGIEKGTYYLKKRK